MKSVHWKLWFKDDLWIGHVTISRCSYHILMALSIAGSIENNPYVEHYMYMCV